MRTLAARDSPAYCTYMCVVLPLSRTLCSWVGSVCQLPAAGAGAGSGVNLGHLKMHFLFIITIIDTTLSLKYVRNNKNNIRKWQFWELTILKISWHWPFKYIMFFSLKKTSALDFNCTDCTCTWSIPYTGLPLSDTLRSWMFSVCLTSSAATVGAAPGCVPTTYWII